MKPVSTLKHNIKWRSGGIALTYVLTAAAWIVFSDKFVYALESGEPVVFGIPYQTVKGLFFVFVTGLLLYVLVARSMAALRERLVYMRTHDRLTKLPAMEVLRDRVEQDLIHARRSNHIVAIVTLNVDRFHHFINAYGYDAGDKILKAVAERLKELTRPGDTVSRMGGDEFVVALSDIADRKDVDRVVFKLRDGIGQGFAYQGKVIRFSVSCGVALYPQDALDGESLVGRSATALWRAKATERGTVAFYTEALGKEAEAWAQTEHALAGAVQRQEFSLHYQPQVDAQTGHCVGAEALLRWNSAVLGAVPPNRFIPVAEASPLICIIGQWVLDEACQQAAAWRKNGLGDLVVSVNVSARQLKDDDFVQIVQRALKRAGLPACLLELEVTESMLMEDKDASLAKLGALKEIGVRFAIDDFGTGYSNLAHLRRFHADRLKIDQSFVRGLTTDADAQAIVSTIITLGQTMRLRTIAEGVETHEQASALRGLGCKEFQGYLFGKPMPARQFERFQADTSRHTIKALHPSNASEDRRLAS